jgi:hypothetical protein
MENTLFYSFSTIPQIVAAMLALTAIFVMFRIEILHKRIMGFGQRILDEYRSLQEMNTDNAVYDIAFNEATEGRKRKSRFQGAISTDAEKYMIFLIGEIAQIENKLVEQKIYKSIPSKGFNTQFNRVIAISKNKTELISKMKQLVVLSAISILFPLICLVFVPVICFSTTWSVILLGVNFLLACITVIYTVFLARNAIFDEEYEGNE